MKILIERLENEEKRGDLKYYICFERMSSVVWIYYSILWTVSDCTLRI